MSNANAIQRTDDRRQLTMSIQAGTQPCRQIRSHRNQHM